MAKKPAGYGDDPPGRARAASAAAPFEQASIERVRGGGFRLSDRAGHRLTAEPTDAGWSVGGACGIDGWFLEKDGGVEARGFVLRRHVRPGAEEIARSLRAPDREDACVLVIMPDGRLFRMLPRGGGRPGVDLVGWETLGPYLSARRARQGWRIAKTIAGREIAGPLEILVVFAAELLGTEGPD